MSDETETPVLTIAIERNGDVAVVRCSGKLVAGVNDVLHAKASELIPHCKRIVLDLTDLTHMDSVGLGTAVRLYVSGKTKGCEVKLVNLRRQIRQLLTISNLLAVFGTADEYDLPIH